MSGAWAKGSTRRWRKIRQHVLDRDRWQCQLQLDECTAPNIGDLRAQPAHAHHTHGRTITGDDPTHIVASCAHCNLTTGDPTRHPDPTPRPTTRW